MCDKEKSSSAAARCADDKQGSFDCGEMMQQMRKMFVCKSDSDTPCCCATMFGMKTDNN